MIDIVNAGFESRYGYKASGVWSAPGRVNLIGEHTDYNLGFVLPFGINRRTYLALAPRTDNRFRVGSAYSGEVIEVELSDTLPKKLNWSGYPIGVAWVMRHYAQSGFDAWFESEVPVGAGLSSSAAIECSTAIALNDIWNVGLTPKDLAKIGQQAENQVVGAPTGIMDQLASLMAKPDSALFIDCKSLETSQVGLGLEAQNLLVAVIDTTVVHRNSDGGYRSRRQACELGAKLVGATSLRELSAEDLPSIRSVVDDPTFRRVRHVITENQRVLDSVAALRANDLATLGRLLFESHDSMRDDFEISIPELDLAVEVAGQEGAIGSRMTGGGFGGAVIAVIEKTKFEALQLACERAFSLAGFSKPKIFAVSPAAGARREI